MRISIILTLLVTMLMCLQPVDVWATGPRITFQQEVKDLGTMPPGRKVTVRWPFTNSGDRTLVIQDIKAGCDCTEVYNRVREVPPQSGSEIVAVLNTGALDPGKNVRNIKVKSNDRQKPSVTLTLVVKVLR